MKETLIQLVDDDDGIREILGLQLEDAGYRVVFARDGVEALEVYAKHRPELLVTDVRMPRRNGYEVLREIRNRNPRARILIISAYATVESAVRAMKAGAMDLLVKPFGEEQFLAAVREALARELPAPSETTTDEKAGEGDLKIAQAVPRDPVSHAMRAVRGLAETVADTDATVLLLGETGTGKEYLARQIHERSPRSAGPWVPLNCGAIPAELAESELFGHAKGAFTGASAGREGRLQAAAGGTLFLDEIADLSADMQVKLLRFLEDGEIQSPGHDEVRRVDVRIIAATNRDLQAMVKSGDFREDLYYRLNVFSILVPPLRQRPEELAGLVATFLEEAAERYGRPVATLSDAAFHLIAAFEWPGNVRQLRNQCERWSLLFPGRDIEAEDIAGDLATNAEGSNQGSPVSLPAAGINLERLEGDLLAQALERTGGKKTAAARLLGISRHALNYRLEKHGLK